METGQFSIVIPCKNEAGYIEQALQSIRAQSILNDSIQIFIADACSTDGTLQIINQYRKDLNLTVIPGGLPPTGRNRGAWLCRSKYILFMDSDCELGNAHTLEKVLATAENNNLELVIPEVHIKQPNMMDKLFEYSYYVAAKSKILGAFASGMFCFIRRDTFNMLGGFNERLPLGDDWDLSHRIDPAHFELADTFIYTSKRRFIAQGYLPTFYQWINVAFNKEYREKGHEEYFNHA